MLPQTPGTVREQEAEGSGLQSLLSLGSDQDSSWWSGTPTFRWVFSSQTNLSGHAQGCVFQLTVNLVELTAAINHQGIVGL